MRKEPIIAVIIGSLIGLGSAFFLWQTLSKHNSVTKPVTEIQKTQDSNLSEDNSSLSILSPNELSIYTQSKVKLNGLAPKNAIIGVYLNGGYFFGSSNQKGEFEFDIDADGGINNLKVWAFSGDKTFSQTVNFIYTTQIENQEDTLVATAGTITDILEDGLQIKTVTGEIKQITINSDTSYVNIIKESKDSAFEDLAIGDYIVLIGTNKDSSFTAQRVLISTESDLSKVLGVEGKIKTLSAKDFIVATDNDEYSIDATGSVKVTKFDDANSFISARLKEASDGEKIVVLGEMKDELVASRIQIFPTPDK